MVGKSIGHFQILEEIGRGGMGVVYRAQDTKLNRPVALKFLPQQLAATSEEQARFLQEAQAASALNHPGITTIYEIGESGGEAFIVMEYCEGRTLRGVIDSETLSEKRVLDIAIQVCEGLAAAHEKGIVHRDIKSDNIMLTDAGQVKILDFGLAKLRGGGKLTRTGSTLGTAGYMSPEQVSGEEVDGRSDIFSLGVVLYELLTGRLPFRGDHPAAVAYALVHEPAPPVGRFNTQVSARMEEIVSKALAKDRLERYQHADELLADLRRERKAIEHPGTGETAAMQVQQVRASRPGGRALRWAVAAVAVLAMIFLLIVLNPFNLHIGPRQSLAGGDNSIAVMYFENIADPSDRGHTGEMLVNLMITSLSQVKDLDVISRERLYEVERQLGSKQERGFDPSVASEIAGRAGVKTMILGSILETTPSLIVTSREVDVKTGRVLASQRLAGFSMSQIFALVDSMSSEVLSSLNIGTEAVAEAKPVTDVTTSSPEAYRSYVEGQELLYKVYLAEAKAALQTAIDLDRNFAMAYFLMAEVQNDQSDMKGSAKNYAKAAELTNRVSERERLLIQASYLFWVKKDFARSAAIDEELVRKYPHETWAVLDLSIAYMSLGDASKAERTIADGVANNPYDRQLVAIEAYLLAGMNRRDDALRTADRYVRLAPGEPNSYDSKGEICFYFGEVDSALQWWQRAVALRADFLTCEKLGWAAMLGGDYASAEKYFDQLASTNDPLQKLSAATDRAIMVAHQGRLRESEARMDALLHSVDTREIASGELGNLYGSLIALAYEVGDFRGMKNYANACATLVAGNPLDVIYGRDALAWALDKNGEKGLSRKLMETLSSETLHGRQYNLRYIKGLIAYENGAYGDALREFGDPFSCGPLPNHVPQYFYAVTLVKLGRTEEAIQEFQRLTWCFPISYPPIGMPFLPTSAYWPIAAVKAHYWLGVAYEQEGKRGEAIKEFTTFLEIWKNADFKSPELQDARVHLANLKGAPTH